jgi:hypothetical protein
LLLDGTRARGLRFVSFSAIFRVFVLLSDATDLCDDKRVVLRYKMSIIYYCIIFSIFTILHFPIITSTILKHQKPTHDTLLHNAYEKEQLQAFHSPHTWVLNYDPSIHYHIQNLAYLSSYEGRQTL